MTQKTKSSLILGFSVIPALFFPLVGIVPIILMVIFREKQKNGLLEMKTSDSLFRWSYITLAIGYALVAAAVIIAIVNSCTHFLF